MMHKAQLALFIGRSKIEMLVSVFCFIRCSTSCGVSRNFSSLYPMIMWYLCVCGCTRFFLAQVRKVAVITVRGMQLWSSVFRNCLLLKVEVVWFMQVLDHSNITLPLNYPVKLIGTAILNYNLLLDKAGHKIVPIIFSFNIVRKHVSIQDSVVIAKLSNLGY